MFLAPRAYKVGGGKSSFLDRTWADVKEGVGSFLTKARAFVAHPTTRRVAVALAAATAMAGTAAAAYRAYNPRRVRTFISRLSPQGMPTLMRGVRQALPVQPGVKKEIRANERLAAAVRSGTFHEATRDMAGFLTRPFISGM